MESFLSMIFLFSFRVRERRWSVATKPWARRVSGLRKCVWAFCFVCFSFILLYGLHFLRFWKIKALSHRAVRGLYTWRLNHKIAGLTNRTNNNGGDSISLFDLIEINILILLSREIRAWYQILTKKWWGVKPSLFSPFGGLQANDYNLRRLIISC